MESGIRTLKSFTASLVWYNGKKKRPGCGPGIYLTTFYKNGLRLNRIALSKKSDSAEHPSQTAYVLHNVAERGKFIVPLITIHAIGNGDQAHIVLREKLLRQLANLYVVATHPGEVFNKHGRDIPGLDSGQHFLKSGALHGGAGNAIVYEKQGICIAFFPCYL